MKHFNLNYLRLPFIVISLLFTIFFAWVYAVSPFSEDLNSLILNGGTVLSALVAAVVFTLIPSYFGRGEPPRLIWIFFAISMWLWTIAAEIWAYLYMRDGEVPFFTIADIFWMLGYVALTVALARQFKLVSFSQNKSIAWAALGIWAGMVTLIIDRK